MKKMYTTCFLCAMLLCSIAMLAASNPIVIGETRIHLRQEAVSIDVVRENNTMVSYVNCTSSMVVGVIGADFFGAKPVILYFPIPPNATDIHVNTNGEEVDYELLKDSPPIRGYDEYFGDYNTIKWNLPGFEKEWDGDVVVTYKHELPFNR